MVLRFLRCRQDNVTSYQDAKKGDSRTRTGGKRAAKQYPAAGCKVAMGARRVYERRRKSVAIRAQYGREATLKKGNIVSLMSFDVRTFMTTDGNNQQMTKRK